MPDFLKIYDDDCRLVELISISEISKINIYYNAAGDLHEIIITGIEEHLLYYHSQNFDLDKIVEQFAEI